MEKKNKLDNKKIKLEVKKPAAKKEKVDFSKLASHLVVIATKTKHMVEGKEYNVTNAMAQILVGNGSAKLK